MNSKLYLNSGAASGGGLGLLEPPPFHIEHTRKSPRKALLEEAIGGFSEFALLILFFLLIFDIFILK